MNISQTTSYKDYEPTPETSTSTAYNKFEPGLIPSCIEESMKVCPGFIMFMRDYTARGITNR